MAIDDHSRIATSGIYPDEKQGSVIAALRSTLDWYAGLGIRFKAVLTDNGPAYRSLQFAQVCRELGLPTPRHQTLYPRTNGKAERFIQTALREWADARSYNNSQQLYSWLHDYNWHRPHASLNHQPPSAVPASIGITC